MSTNDGQAGAGAGGIVRIEHNKDLPYVVVSKTLSEDRRLSFALRGMLTFLLGKRDDWTTYMSHIEASGKEGREAIKALFQEGRNFGYIVTVERRIQGRMSYEHTIHEVPLEKPVPRIITDSGAPSSVTKRQSRAASGPVNGKPSTGSRQRSAVNGSPSPETRSLVSNDPASNEDQVINTLAADAATDPEPPNSEPPTPTPTPTQEADASPVQEQSAGKAGGKNKTKALDTVPGAAAAGSEPREGYQPMYDVVWEAFREFRMTNKGAILGRRVNESLDLGYTLPEVRQAMAWAFGDLEFWAKKLTPASFGKMLEAWEANRRPVQRPGSPANTPMPPAPDAQPESGKARRFL